ncbi:uncharacterized protein knl1 isoform X2 [Halichoeres trimaculatus]|uniref:uncharacterized protein knl1 isoform X2 n=1 Tax=Halichoeres trimaculatus TaxID=147232 RepID=UPI003D9E8392
MEPLDPFRNEGSSGPSKRRISSILKAPRKSIMLPDPEQQENVVECAKPVDKRNSRRVSFAPANDVLLFSKDAKNVSPARSPLQELTTATADTQNRSVQFAVTENGIQQITGMETLLKAPLHAFQQKDMTNSDAEFDFGEKTMLFSTEDASMDMTHCQTINIASEADVLEDIPLHNYHILPTGGEKMVMFTADGGSMDKTINTPSGSAALPGSRNMDLRAEKKNTASLGLPLDPEFESFFASLSQPSRSSVNPVVPRTSLPPGASSRVTNNSFSQLQTQQAGLDKENQAPSFVPDVFEKTMNASLALFPDDDVSMDMTEAQTGRIQAFSDNDDNPFQFLFPSQEMYSQNAGKESQTAEMNKQQSRRTLPSSSKDVPHLQKTFLPASLPRHQIKADTKDENRDKTIRFTAGDDFMDMTQSHTVHISSDSFPPPNKTSDVPPTSKETDKAPTQRRKTESSSAHGVDLEFKNFLAGLSKVSGPGGNPANARRIPPAAVTPRSFGEGLKGDAVRPEKDVNVDVTGARSSPPGSDDLFPFLFPSKKTNPNGDKRAEITSGQKTSQDQGSWKSAGQETPLKSSLKSKVQRNQAKFESEDDQRERTVRFSADDAAMDETRSHTVNIVSDFQSKQNLDCFPAFGEKTVRFTANDAAMDMTQSHTVNIAAQLEQQQHTDFLPQYGEKTVRFTANDAAMDMTQCLTVNIASDEILGSVPPVACDVPGSGYKGAKLRPESDVNMSVNRGEVDVSMDMTEAQTGRIVETQKTDTSALKRRGLSLQLQHSGGSLDRKGLGSSLTASLRTKQQRQQVQCDSEDDRRDRTLRFSADDAAMDVTRSHTVNITNFVQQPLQNEDCLPVCGEKTVRFTADDADMDLTRSLTSNIAASVLPKSHQMVDVLPLGGEKTLRFSADDAAMDETRSFTVNIAASSEPQQEKMGFGSAYGERTVRFSADDAAMDVTKSLTVNIAASVEPKSQQMTDVSPPGGEKTLRFSADDAAMEVTQCLTVNIASNSESNLSHQESNILSTPDKDFPLSEKRREIEPRHQRKTKSFTAHSLDIGLGKSLARKSGPFAYSSITKASVQGAADSTGLHDQLSQINDVGTEASAFVSSEKAVNKTMTEDVTMDITKAQTGQILGQTFTDENPKILTSTQDRNPKSDHFRKTEAMSQNHEAQETSVSHGDKITNRPESVDSNESDTWKESEPRLQTLSSTQKNESSPPAVDHDADAAQSRKSRRMSLADLHTKIRRLSHMINTAPDTMEDFTAHSGDRSPKDRAPTPPVTEPEPETSSTNPNENTEAQNQTLEDPPFSPITTTPYNLKTRQLLSRLSVSTFEAKLPQRPRPEDQKKVISAGDHTRTMPLNVTNQLNNFDADVSDINDEELGSLEDETETINTRTPQKTSRLLSPPEKIHMEEPLEGDLFEEDFMSAVCGRKRPLEEKNSLEEDEKRMKGSTEVDAVFLSPAEGESPLECDGNFATAPITSTQNTDYSNISHTGSRCEATFESTFKHSLFESQLEEYASDVQAKFDDGTITVLEFFKLFSIDFVIHTPRQSVNPGRLMSDSDCTPMDLLKDRHIGRPKQMVYESDVRSLTEKVEGLKGRMQDLEKPLRIVNRALWEEMRNLSEKELKTFGAKLKERNHFFRKTSKVRSHEMKEVLYSQIVQADLEEQQKLRGRIEEANKMMESLDECIHELETELAEVEEKGSEDRPSLKSCQEELQKVTEAVADTERQTSELEMQKTQNLNKIKRLKSETRNLERRISVLNMITEWRFGEKKDDCTVYTFLYDTFHLRLDYHKSNGCDAENQSERKISDIKFTLELDGEKSVDHACLVHKLLSQYVDGETSWVKKYPTSRHVPKLLHDVSLVVSRCRLLGEEVRLLKLWGSVRLNILNISCVDTRVLIVFSSLKTFSKFEVIFSVTLTNQLCVLHVQSFRNMIGNTTIEQIEEIVASSSPGKNQLTKIVKKINEKLLC